MFVYLFFSNIKQEVSVWGYVARLEMISSMISISRHFQAFVMSWCLVCLLWDTISSIKIAPELGDFLQWVVLSAREMTFIMCWKNIFSSTVHWQAWFQVKGIGPTINHKNHRLTATAVKGEQEKHFSESQNLHVLCLAKQKFSGKSCFFSSFVYRNH